MDRPRAAVLVRHPARRRQLRRGVSVRAIACRDVVHVVLRRRGAGDDPGRSARGDARGDAGDAGAGRRLARVQRRDPRVSLEPSRRGRRRARPRLPADERRALPGAQHVFSRQDPAPPVAGRLVRRIRRLRSGLPDARQLLHGAVLAVQRRRTAARLADARVEIPRALRAPGREPRRRIREPQHADVLSGGLRDARPTRSVVGLDRAGDAAGDQHAPPPPGCTASTSSTTFRSSTTTCSRTRPRQPDRSRRCRWSRRPTRV